MTIETFQAYLSELCAEQLVHEGKQKVTLETARTYLHKLGYTCAARQPRRRAPAAPRPPAPRSPPSRSPPSFSGSVGRTPWRPPDFKAFRNKKHDEKGTAPGPTLVSRG